MTKEIPRMQNVLDFIECYKDHGLGTTGCDVVNFSSKQYPTKVKDKDGNYVDVLYNVDGSDGDKNHIPDKSSKSWKQLLVDKNITGACYVESCYPLPNAPSSSSHSHRDFDLGGHVTIEHDGTVTDHVCYLMPLCEWHNNKSRDKTKFSYKKSEMMQLTGYLQGELPATFQLRLPSKEPYAILYYTEEGWTHQNLSKEQAMNLKTEFLPKINKGEEVNYVLFERVHEAQTMHYIREVNLPGSES